MPYSLLLNRYVNGDSGVSMDDLQQAWTAQRHYHSSAAPQGMVINGPDNMAPAQGSYMQAVTFPHGHTNPGGSQGTSHQQGDHHNQMSALPYNRLTSLAASRYMQHATVPQSDFDFGGPTYQQGLQQRPQSAMLADSTLQARSMAPALGSFQPGLTATYSSPHGDAMEGITYQAITNQAKHPASSAGAGANHVVNDAPNTLAETEVVFRTQCQPIAAEVATSQTSKTAYHYPDPEMPTKVHQCPYFLEEACPCGRSAARFSIGEPAPSVAPVQDRFAETGGCDLSWACSTGQCVQVVSSMQQAMRLDQTFALPTRSAHDGGTAPATSQYISPPLALRGGRSPAHVMPSTSAKARMDAQSAGEESGTVPPGQLGHTPKPNTLLPTCDLTALEILLITPRFTEVDECVWRLMCNGWSHRIVTKLLTHFDPKIQDEEKMVNALRAKYTNAAKAHGFTTVTAAQESGTLRPVGDYSTTTWDPENTARKDTEDKLAKAYAREKKKRFTPVTRSWTNKEDVFLSTFAKRLAMVPQGPDRGVFSQCIQIACEKRREDLKISDIPSLIQQYGLSMPAVGAGVNRDVEALKRMRAILGA